jgi:hypothetical protein
MALLERDELTTRKIRIDIFDSGVRKIKRFLKLFIVTANTENIPIKTASVKLLSDIPLSTFNGKHTD